MIFISLFPITFHIPISFSQEFPQELLRSLEVSFYRLDSLVFQPLPDLLLQHPLFLSMRLIIQKSFLNGLARILSYTLVTHKSKNGLNPHKKNSWNAD